MTADLRLYNTLTRRKEPFAPIDPKNVRLYACGPTVYDLAHIGNARPVIVFDLLFRLLRHLYGPAHVTYVRNVTDVDDKINARAARDFPGVPLNEAIRRVTTETERQFQEDIRALGVLMPEDVNVAGERPRMLEPRATEHIDAMRRMIDRLVAAGHAYVAADHVLFDVPSMPDYGRLSRRPLDEMEAGARVDVAPYKRSPLDFVLWKPSGPGEPAWPSPAGIAAPGRPGWHIECSAMSWQHLGERFDIHAGGLDLIFPHHENEIAQSRCCFGTPAMANVWMHNGFLQVEGQKMSKSLGNFTTIRDVLNDWPGEVVRLNMLKTHYRQPIDWRVQDLLSFYDEMRGWTLSITLLFERHGILSDDHRFDDDHTGFLRRKVSAAFVGALTNDLNFPLALTILRETKLEIMTGSLEAAIQQFADLEFAGFLSKRSLLIWAFGVHADLSTSQRWDRETEKLRTHELNQDISRRDEIIRHLQSHGVEVLPIIDGCWKVVDRTDLEAETLIDARQAARAAKDWAESDRIRDELKAMGVQVKDNKDGTTTWEVVR